MKLSSITFMSFILLSDVLVSGQPRGEKVHIDLRPSNLYVKCGSSEYRSNELDNAASKACSRMITKGKVMGLYVKSLPENYHGSLAVEFNGISESSHHPQDHNTQVGHHPLLMWSLKNKFRHLKAKCYAIIQWNPETGRCKAVAAIMRERKRDDVRCNLVNIQDPSSKNAGNSSPLNPGSQSPFNSDHQRIAKELYRAPTFSTYHQDHSSQEITEEVD